MREIEGEVEGGGRHAQIEHYCSSLVTGYVNLISIFWGMGEMTTTNKKSQKFENNDNTIFFFNEWLCNE